MSTEFYLFATLAVVLIFIFILKKVFTELDAADSFVQLPEQKGSGFGARKREASGQKSAADLDDFAATELVRQMCVLYDDFGAPDAEVAAQMDALRNANAAQINSLLAGFLAEAQSSIEKASGAEKAQEFYERAGQIYSQICSR